MSDKKFTPQKLDFYVDFINQFFKTGCIPEVSINLSADDPFLELEDPILDYLRNHFSKMAMNNEAFSDLLHKTAYRNALIYFVTKLLSELRFYQEVEEIINEEAEEIEYVYRKNLQIMQEAIGKKEIKPADIVKLGEGYTQNAIKSMIDLMNRRKRFPSLEKIISLLGRTPSETGGKRASLIYGHHNLPHSGGSDIQGITVGQSFASLLPLETALFSDCQTEDIFLHKYTFYFSLSRTWSIKCFAHARPLGSMSP